MVKNRRLPLAKAMCVNRFTRAKGGNVTIFDGQNNVVDHADGDYADEPMIYRALQPLPRFGDSYTYR